MVGLFRRISSSKNFHINLLLIYVDLLLQLLPTAAALLHILPSVCGFAYLAFCLPNNGGEGNVRAALGSAGRESSSPSPPVAAW
jgi:hypothetical protein